MASNRNIAKNHGPAVYVMHLMGATAKLVLSSLHQPKKPPFCIDELTARLTPAYDRRIESILQETAVKADGTSKLKGINAVIIEMIRAEMVKTPTFVTVSSKITPCSSVDHLPLSTSAPAVLGRLWTFLGFIEKCIVAKFVWKHCCNDAPKAEGWADPLKRLCEETNPNGNKDGKDNTLGKVRLPKITDIFGEIFDLIVTPDVNESLCRNLRLGKIPAALRAASTWRDIEGQFLTQNIRGPYFVYRRARSSITNAKVDIGLIVRDFIWILPEVPVASSGNFPVLGYYFSAFDQEVYEITTAHALQEPRSMLKIDATAIRSKGFNKSLSVYVPTVPLERSDTFTLGTITGTLRDTQRSGGWSCVVMRPKLGRKNLQTLNTVIYSFLRHLSNGATHYALEIDRMREVIEDVGLSGVYTSQALELEHEKFLPQIEDYISSNECAKQRRLDVMACLCHDESRQTSIKRFASNLISKHDLHSTAVDEKGKNEFLRRIEAALLEAVFESTTSSVVPTAGLDDINRMLGDASIKQALYGPDGIRIDQNTIGFHGALTERLGNCNTRKTIPMKDYVRLASKIS